MRNGSLWNIKRSFWAGGNFSLKITDLRPESFSSESAQCIKGVFFSFSCNFLWPIESKCSHLFYGSWDTPSVKIIVVLPHMYWFYGISYQNDFAWMLTNTTSLLTMESWRWWDYLHLFCRSYWVSPDTFSIGDTEFCFTRSSMCAKLYNTHTAYYDV